jgi:uncharacterized protein YqjF (DUF2071 family)
MDTAAAYRPYPAPTAPFVMHQAWHDLLFMHWRVDVDALRRIVPSVLPLDLFDGSAWLGIVPFEMRDVRPRFLPAFPRLSFFPELNVRTYVTLRGRPGVYFFSLDASNPIAVELARRVFHLPYRNATMECSIQGDTVHYGSSRTDRRAAPAYFRARYRPVSDPFLAPKGSLEYFLTARYCLYTTDPRGNALCGEIDHTPWLLQHAECEIETNTMTGGIGVSLPRDAPHLLFARRMDMVAWLPYAVKE